MAALGQGAIPLQLPEQLGQQAGGALPLLGAAAAALGAEEGWPQQAPLGLGEVVGELGARAHQLQHRFAQAHGLFGGGAGHREHQVAVLQHRRKPSPDQLQPQWAPAQACDRAGLAIEAPAEPAGQGGHLLRAQPAHQGS